MVIGLTEIKKKKKKKKKKKNIWVFTAASTHWNLNETERFVKSLAIEILMHQKFVKL